MIHYAPLPHTCQNAREEHVRLLNLETRLAAFSILKIKKTLTYVNPMDLFFTYE